MSVTYYTLEPLHDRPNLGVPTPHTFEFDPFQYTLYAQAPCTKCGADTFEPAHPPWLQMPVSLCETCARLGKDGQ